MPVLNKKHKNKYDFILVTNAVCFNLNRTTPVPAWLHDLIFNKVAPIVTWQSCWYSIRKRGTFNPSAICEGVFAAILRKKIEDEESLEIANNDMEGEDEKQFFIYYNKVDEWQIKGCYSSSSSIDSSIETNVDYIKSNVDYTDCLPGYRCATGKPYDSMRSYDDLPLNTALLLMKQNERDAKNVSALSERELNDNEGENVADFWRCMSQSADRFLFLFFAFLYVLIAIILFLLVPLGNL